MLSLPLIAITILVKTLPKASDLPLDAKVELTTEPVTDAHFLIVNQSEDLWKSIRLTINKAFYYLPSSHLPPGEELKVPLNYFGHKGGHRFDIAKGDIREFTISVRLPNNRRALKEMDFSKPNPED